MTFSSWTNQNCFLYLDYIIPRVPPDVSVQTENFEEHQLRLLNHPLSFTWTQIVCLQDFEVTLAQWDFLREGFSRTERTATCKNTDVSVTTVYYCRLEFPESDQTHCCFLTPHPECNPNHRTLNVTRPPTQGQQVMHCVLPLECRPPQVDQLSRRRVDQSQRPTSTWLFCVNEV